MIDSNSVSEQWLKAEDITCFKDRLERLEWLANLAPKTLYWTFPGGLNAKYLFEECRYCFVYGQFLATIILGLAFIEHTLAALFYAEGRNELERASISVLLKEALRSEWLSQVQYDNLEHTREIRNAATHFRRPGHQNTIMYRAISEAARPYQIIEKDARHIVEVVLILLNKAR
jgi:hypothetical protein